MPTPTPDDQLTEDTRGGVTVPATAQPGETITVTVPGAAGRTVRVWLHSEPVLLVTAVVGADETVLVTIPTDAQPGEHTIVLQAADGMLIGWAPIEITAAAGEMASPGGALADTGIAVEPLLLMTALTLLIGGALLRRLAR